MILYKQKFFAMGCQMMAMLEAPSHDDAVPPADGKPASQAAELLAQVPQWFEQWEQHLSRFRTDSKLSALNRSTGVPFQSSPILWEVFSLAVLAEQRSRGWVTPTIYDALIDSGYAQSFADGVPAALFTEKPAAQLTPCPAPLLNQVQVDKNQCTINLPPGVHLDFGGIAKGWAAETALQRLQCTGPALVDAGGDIAVGEPLSGNQPWPIAIETLSGACSSDELLMLSRCGVATSGRDYRRWRTMASGSTISLTLIPGSRRKPMSSAPL